MCICAFQAVAKLSRQQHSEIAMPDNVDLIRAIIALTQALIGLVREIIAAWREWRK